MRKVIKIFFVLICMITIFFFSNDNASQSSKKSDGLIIRISEIFLKRGLNENEKLEYTSKYVKPIRKCAHFIIYFLLGLSFISLLSEYMIVDKRSIIYTIIFVCLYACSDELHQLFIPGRSGEVIDVFIDTLGGTVGSFIYKVLLKLRS